MGAAEYVDPNASLWDWLTYDLRFYRTQRDQTLDQVAARINRSKGWVSNVEAGRRRITDVEAKTLDDLWGTGGHFVRLLRYARAGHDPDWFKQHVEYEARASILKVYELSVVPGLLQTEAYARALFTAARSKDVDAQVAARVARRETLYRGDAPQAWILLDETVIVRPVGGVEVMREQLSALLEAAELTHVTLRVVPFDAGAHVGLDGGFKVIRADGVDMAYSEATGGGRLVVGAEEIRSYTTRFDQIGAEALSRSATKSRLRQAMEAMK